MPVDKERLTMLVMVGARIDMDCLSMDVGMGSSSHCLVGACRMSLVISLTSAKRNCRKEGGVLVGCGK